MRRALALAVPLALVAVPATAQAPTRPTVTIDQQQLTYGDETDLTATLPGGAADAGTSVDVIRRLPPATSYQRVARGTANADGKVAFSIAPPANAYYGVATKSATSLAYLVHMSPAITLQTATATPRRNALVGFSGTVEPQLDGQQVSLQRHLAAGGWRTVANAHLTHVDQDSSAFAMRIRVTASGTYRVTSKGTASFDAGASQPAKLHTR